MRKDLSWLHQLPGRPLIVAEIKQRSPFGWTNPLRWEEQLAICEEVGDIISVHTNELWGGSWTHLTSVRPATTKPILAKGFHDTVADVLRALDAGADHVLTVGWDGGPLWEHCWHEPETMPQLCGHRDEQRMVWNARNPRTGERRGISPVLARKNCAGWLCQASSIKGPEDVALGMNAVLIGEGLYA